jgi:hypothetical protein
VLDAEVVEHAHDHAADVVLAPVGVRQRLDQEVERALGLAVVQGLERLRQLGRLALEADP